MSKVAVLAGAAAVGGYACHSVTPTTATGTAVTAATN